MTTSALVRRSVIVQLAPRTWGAGEPWVDLHVPVTLPARDHKLGYYVRRADTGQDLGMVSKTSEGWRAYVLNSAYYPADADIMVRTTHHRDHRGETWASGELVETSATREDAVHRIVSVLVERRAVSVEDLVDKARAPFLATRTGLAS